MIQNPFIHDLIIVSRLMADIHQMKDVAEILRRSKIILHHLAPGELFLLADLREAVARQTDEIDFIVDLIDVDEPRFPRRGARSGELVAVGQPCLSLL